METHVAPTRAVEIASRSLGELVPTFASLQPHVEEIRRSTDGSAWIINFRADNPEPKEEKRGLGSVFFPYIEKVVRIRIDSGDLVSIENHSYE